MCLCFKPAMEAAVQFLRDWLAQEENDAGLFVLTYSQVIIAKNLSQRHKGQKHISDA